MALPTKRMLLTVAAFGAAGSMAFTVGALAHGGGNGGGHHGDHGRSIELKLTGSLTTDPAVNGVAPGQKDWLGRGKAKVRRDGTVKVKVRGLVFKDTGTTTSGPAVVSTVTASVWCNGTVVAGTIPAAPLSSTGDAVITGTVTLPAACAGATVLVHPNGNPAAYIAFSGVRF